jgi:hypothetical protein
MLDISAANQLAIESDVPWPVDFLELIVDPSDPSKIIRICTHFHDITTEGRLEPGVQVTFTAASQLLAFGSVANNLEAKDNALDISLSGIGQEITAVVLANPIAGAVVYVMRGFYLEESGSIADTPYQRWAGRVNSFSIQDDFTFGEDNIVISLSCTSLLNTLLQRVAGRFTNDSSQQYFYPGDKSMEFVDDLVNFAPDFGKGQQNPPPPPSGGGGKIVCTAMNENYGFGSFRNAVWLNYAKENLTPYHEKGYHAIFRPWVDAMYKDTWYSPFLTKWGEGIARRRSADIFAVMKGRKKRSWLARIERAITEPLCYLVGRWFIK